MRTALQRQLTALGWRAVGFALGLLMLAGVAALWGHRIEGRIDRVDVQRHHDHRLIIRLAEGKPLRSPKHDVQISSKEVQNLEQQAGGEEATEAPSQTEHHTGKEEVQAHEPKATHHPKPAKPKVVNPAPPVAAPEPTTSATPPPTEEPGNSGDTPAAQNSNGLKACVSVAVSACLNAGLTEAP